MTNEIKLKMRDYGIKSVSSTVVDGKIKFVGIPDFPWIYGVDLYVMLKKKYPLKP